MLSIAYGIFARNNVGGNLGGNFEEGFDDETWIGGVSRIDINDNGGSFGGDNCENESCVMSSFKSVHDTPNRPNGLSKNTMFVYTNLSLVNPFMVDQWKDATPNKRISIQFQIATGVLAHKKLNVRVSTDGMSLVVTHQASKYLTNPKKSLLAMLLKRGLNKESAAELLMYHPRIIARKTSIAALIGRSNSEKKLEYDFRIPLPYKCRHKITTELDGDKYFYGINYFEYGNGEVWCHVELVAQMMDDYRSEKLEAVLEQMEETSSCEEEESSDEEYTVDEQYEDDTLMTEASGSRVTRSTARSLAAVSKKSSTPSKKSSTPSKKSSTPSKKSSTPSKKSSTSKKRSPTASDYFVPIEEVYNEFEEQNFLKPPKNVVIKPTCEATKGRSIISQQSSRDTSFMTPEDESVEVYSIANSTINTMDSNWNKPFNSKTNAVVSVKDLAKNYESESSLVSKKSERSSRKKKTTSIISSKKSKKPTSRSRKKSSNERDLADDDKSRSGRSSTGSRTSRSSETPTTKNLSSDVRKIIGPQLEVNDMLPKNPTVSSLKIPASTMITFDENARVTRSSTKRTSSTKSNSSDESHQKQDKKYIRVCN